MAHYAKVRDSIVVDMIVADEDFFETFIDTSAGTWIQCSYNTREGIHYGQDDLPDGGKALRYNYPALGYSYDEDRDAFIPPKENNGWILDESKCIWVSPKPYPEDGKVYIWNNATEDWTEVNELEG